MVCDYAYEDARQLHVDKQCSCFVPHQLDDCHLRKEISFCLVCQKPFKVGDELHAFLRSPDDYHGSWSDGIIVDEGFAERFRDTCDYSFSIKRKHTSCEDFLNGM